MQRYHAGSCTSALNNNGSIIGSGPSSGLGISSRDSARVSASLSNNFPIISRRAATPPPYRIKCEKKVLNSRLGPPDFHPQTLDCPEETLTKEYVQSGYRETTQGLEAGQVYGESLSGGLLSRPAIFPEQKSCGDDLKKRWIEGISQCHKSLRSLADHVPHGYSKKSLFDVLVKNNVPLSRATWFIKVTYLNQNASI